MKVKLTEDMKKYITVAEMPMVIEKSEPGG